MFNKCVVCNGNLTPYLDLGLQPLANSYKKSPEEFELVFPLVIGYCESCWHSQLMNYVDPNLLFSNYLYVSGTSNTLIKYFYDFSASYIPEGLRILEIASNDGTLMKILKNKSKRVTGVDPASNLVSKCNEEGLEAINAFWGLEETTTKISSLGSYDIAIALNVLGHTPTPQDFLIQLHKVLVDKPTVLIQTSQYDMLRNYEFDTIYHEHISCFTAKSMAKLAEITGWKISALEKKNFQGTSLLTVLGKTEEGKSLHEFIKEEEAFGIYNPSIYEKFSGKAKEITKNLSDYIEQARRKGRKVIGYGSSAKGNTLLNYGKIALDYIIDDNPLKWGLFTPGMSIPVVSTDKIKEIEGPTTVIVLAWNFLEEIMGRTKQYSSSKDIEFITYFPELRRHL